jgi:hypothetical protein
MGVLWEIGMGRVEEIPGRKWANVHSFHSKSGGERISQEKVTVFRLIVDDWAIMGSIYLPLFPIIA